MCGIAGIIGQVDSGNRQALSRMGEALRHRGPDGGGTWIGPADESGRGCLLIHRRLSILDLSSAADQPMVDPAGGNALVFNGEIYNYRAIRKDLESSGHRFQSSGDTEVLFQLLSVRGYDSVRSLRGMFAFAMWNGATRELILVRDPLGIKPLYMARNPDRSGAWSLIFASEVRALLASGLLSRPRLDPTAVASILWNGFVPGPQTIVAGISSLGPGELRVIDVDGAQRNAKTYWTFPPPDGQPGHEAEVRATLEESIRLHLVSDVPLGVFLSGGIDSSAVANLAQRASEGPIHTFTLAFEEERHSEGEIARQVALAIGTDHREVLLTQSRFVSNFDQALDALDQPTFDGVNTFYMAQAVREAGLTVALVGTGGDELFGGYKSFRYLPVLRRWSERTRWIPGSMKAPVARLAATLFGRRQKGPIPPQLFWAKLPEMVAAADDLLRLYQLAYAIFLPDYQRKLMLSPPTSDDLVAGLPRSMAEQLVQEIEGRSSLNALSVLEQRCFLGERLLRDSDSASMAASLELRLPLVDQVLVEQTNRLSDDRRYQPVGSKAILRRIGLTGLDPGLFDRPKRGFVLPYDDWIRRDLGDVIDGLMRDERAAAAVGLSGPAVRQLWESYRGGAPGLYWSRVWAIYVFIRWCHKNGVFL